MPKFTAQGGCRTDNNYQISDLGSELYCIYDLELDCIVSTYLVGDGAVVSAGVGPTKPGEASEGCWTALHSIKLSNAALRQCRRRRLSTAQAQLVHTALACVRSTVESPSDCWFTGVVQNMAKADAWGRMDMKEGKTGGYLILRSLREKESEMEKNQVCDGQERPFCYEQRKISRAQYRHCKAGLGSFT